MASIESTLTRDLRWREAELAAMKSLLIKTEKNSRARSAMLRSCTALLYAHYEGFCKFCWETYLDEIEHDASLVADKLISELAILAVRKLFKETRSDLSDEGLWTLAHASLPSKLGARPKFEIRPDTKSNLWPNLLKDNLHALGLESPELSNFSTSIGSLVGKRNGIAHGESLTIRDINEFVGFEKAATMVMHDIALAMIEAVESRAYAVA